MASMKRPMAQKDEMEEPIENSQVASTLMLLSRSSNGHGHKTRVFECKTCNRQFPSFQALGGHRASHKKPRHMGSDQVIHLAAERSKPRVHECSICGLEFSIGQALGGHMRRHRANGEGKRVADPLMKAGLGLNLDLNLAPPDVDELELRLVEKVRFVDWLH